MPEQVIATLTEAKVTFVARTVGGGGCGGDRAGTLRLAGEFDGLRVA